MLSMVLAMVRNWREHDRLMAAEWTSYAVVVHERFSAFVQQVESLGVSATNSIAQDALSQGPKLVEEQKNKQEDLDSKTKKLGMAAMVLTSVGYLALLVFAIKNAAGML